MVLLMAPSDGGQALKIDASKITAAKLHTSTGMLVITYTNANSASVTTNVYGQDGIDTYNALVAIAAATLSTVT
jgi:hypothetical protein